MTDYFGEGMMFGDGEEQEASMAKIAVREKDGFKFEFTKGDGEILCRALKGKVEVMDYAYPDLPKTGRSIEQKADFWIDQAAMDARAAEAEAAKGGAR